MGSESKSKQRLVTCSISDQSERSRKCRQAGLDNCFPKSPRSFSKNQLLQRLESWDLERWHWFEQPFGYSQCVCPMSYICLNLSWRSMDNRISDKICGAQATLWTPCSISKRGLSLAGAMLTNQWCHDKRSLSSRLIQWWFMDFKNPGCNSNSWTWTCVN